MQKEEQNKQLTKFVIILVAVLIFAMLTVALVQTFVLKGLQNKYANIDQQNKQTLQQIDETQNEYDIRSSDEFGDESLKKDGYGKPEDIIIKQG